MDKDIPTRGEYFRPRRLQTNIIFAFAALLFAVLLAVLFSINNILTNSANNEIQKNLATGNHLFNFLNEEYSRKLTESASVLASDFAFREAIATTEHGTILSVLNNHGARFKASAMFLVNTEHHMIADTIGLTHPNESSPFPELLVTAEHEGQATGIVLLNEHLYQVVIVPVLAPTPIAWLASGFIIDQEYARNLQSLTGLDVSFLIHQQATGQWRRLASTLSLEQSEKLPSALSDVIVDTKDNVVKLQVGEEDYLARIPTLASHTDNRIVAVLQVSLPKALVSLRKLQKLLLILTIFSFLAALMASILVARNITTPLRKLGELAQRIEHGDYSQSIVPDRHDEIGQLFSAFNHMSSGIAERELKIKDLANRDALTGLPNRVLFYDRLGQSIKGIKRNGPAVAVMIMDLDRFKEVNDSLGHHIGDLLLQEVARRLQATLKREYDTVARLGGDEFAILIAADEEGTQIVVNNLLKALEQPILLEDQEIIINVSIGITFCPRHGHEINTLLRQADLAMYAAKRNNEGFVIFDANLEQHKLHHLSLMAELRQAIAKDEFTLYYQPKLELATGTISHIEALVRWIHPERGLVPPDDFIPFSEHTGFIKFITLWVLEHALRQQKTWQEIGVAPTISINLSARDLYIKKFPTLLADLITSYGVSPQKLILEITESSIMADPQSALGTLHELKDIGLRLSVDDFGTGYSSLSYLKKLPVSELKIDKSFVFNMVNDRDDAIIVQSTIDLGHNMGLTVVAEGVENLSTWTMLEALNCDFLQGYYISRPLSAKDLLLWSETSPWKLHKIP